MLRIPSCLSMLCHCEQAPMSPHIHPQPNGETKKKHKRTLCMGLKIKDCLPTKTSATNLSTRPLVYLSTRLLIVFIVFSYRRLSDVMCVDRHWKLVYRWISAHITLLVEHTPISGSLLFFL